MRKLSFPVAFDPEGRLVFSEEAVPGAYHCTGCASSMVLRRGSRVRPHFAHKAGGGCPQGETALHQAAKQAIAAGFRTAVESGVPYWMRVRCYHCSGQHEWDLTREGRAIAVEAACGPVRPDLLIRDGQGAPSWAVEVVVTHPPDEGTESLYDVHVGKPVGFVRAEWEMLGQLRERLEVQAVLGLERLCPTAAAEAERWAEWAARADREHPPTMGADYRCPGCGDVLDCGSVRFTAPPCWKCQAASPVAFLEEVPLWSTPPAAHAFAEMVAAWGVRMYVDESRMAAARYLMNHCTRCGAKRGDFYLSTAHWDHPTLDFRKAGHCARCDRWHVGPAEVPQDHGPPPSIAERLRPPGRRQRLCG